MYNHLNVLNPLFFNLLEILFINLAEESVIELSLLILLLFKKVLLFSQLSKTLLCQASLFFLLSLSFLLDYVSLLVLVDFDFFQKFTLNSLMLSLSKLRISAS